MVTHETRFFFVCFFYSFVLILFTEFHTETVLLESEQLPRIMEPFAYIPT